MLWAVRAAAAEAHRQHRPFPASQLCPVTGRDTLGTAALVLQLQGQAEPRCWSPVCAQAALRCCGPALPWLFLLPPVCSSRGTALSRDFPALSLIHTPPCPQHLPVGPWLNPSPALGLLLSENISDVQSPGAISSSACCCPSVLQPQLPQQLTSQYLTL